MKNILVVTFFLSAIAAHTGCKQHDPYINLPGNYRSHTQWNGNDITMKIATDSTFTFTAYTNRGVIFCSAGTWTMQDSLLLLKGYAQDKQIDMEKLFPELKGLKNVVALQMDGKFIVRGDKLYNITPEGKAHQEEYYDKQQ